MFHLLPLACVISKIIPFTYSVNYRLHMKNKHQIEIRVREKVTRRKPQLICEVCNKPLLDEPQKEVGNSQHSASCISLKVILMQRTDLYIRP